MLWGLVKEQRAQRLSPWSTEACFFRMKVGERGKKEARGRWWEGEREARYCYEAGRGTPGRWGNPLRLGNPLAHIISHFYHIYMIGGWGDHMRDYMARQVTSPTPGPHLHVNRPLIISIGIPRRRLCEQRDAEEIWVTLFPVKVARPSFSVTLHLLSLRGIPGRTCSQTTLF